MGNKDGWICSHKSRQSTVSCSQADPCQLLSFLPPSSLTLSPQVGQAEIRKFPSLVALPCLSLLFKFGGEGSWSWWDRVTHSPHSGVHTLSHGENAPTAVENLCQGFHCKTALENCSGKSGTFLVTCSQRYQASLLPTLWELPKLRPRLPYRVQHNTATVCLLKFKKHLAFGFLIIRYFQMTYWEHYRSKTFCD